MTIAYGGRFMEVINTGTWGRTENAEDVAPSLKNSKLRSNEC